MKKEKRILSIGAHPDDADTYCGGLLSKLRDKGWQVRLLSVTDGSAGTYHAEVTREELKLQRRSEAAASGRLLGGLSCHPCSRFIFNRCFRKSYILDISP